MKKIVLFIAFITLSVSCSDITDLNEETKRPESTKPEFLFTYGQKALVDQMVNTSVNLNVFRLFAQQWTETTYPDESQYDITTRTVPDNHFRVLYRDALANLNKAKSILSQEVPATPEEAAILKNKIAIVDILMSYSYSVLVDTFGNVPYSESLDIENHPLPKYDDAQTIYKDLISRLTADAAAITDTDSFGSADLVYGGNAIKWAKFANSLKLRMALNMFDVDSAYATSQITSAVAGGVITNSGDNTNLNYLSLQPNANPLYADLVVSGRNDFVPANTFVDKLNVLSDPRRAKYFTLSPDGTYKGGIYGASNSFANYSHVSGTIAEPTFPGTIMDNAEVEFLLAEAAARGVAVGGTAQSHYNAAITASMTNWGNTSAEISAYLGKPEVAYATAAGNFQQKIGEQAWIALYNRGFEAWTSYRRLDYPILSAPANAFGGLTKVPVRYSYPAAEKQTNLTNVNEAITAIGGNTLLTPVFWDKH